MFGIREEAYADYRPKDFERYATIEVVIKTHFMSPEKDNTS
jgi:hypothetical protein